MNEMMRIGKSSKDKSGGRGCSSSSSEWLRNNNPRIVRVSRASGGKDRHSKVCTVRGLRDRRIRLSVPTAIQLYDLQHRLGLSQPSQVVDWLLQATNSDIDKLPPLPIISHHFPQFQSLQLAGPTTFSDASANHHPNLLKSTYYNNNNNNYLDLDVNSSSSSSLKGKQVVETSSGYCLTMNNNNLSQFAGSHGYNSHHHQQQVANPSQLLFCPPSSDLILHQILSSTSSSSLPPPPPPPNHVLFQSLHHSSPLRRLPTLFSSKLLDLDPNSNNPSQPDNNNKS